MNVDAEMRELMVGEAQEPLARFLAPMPREAVARALVRRAERGARRTGRPVGDVFRELIVQEIGRREQALRDAQEVTARLRCARRIQLAPRGIGIPDLQDGDVQVSRGGRGGR